MLLPFVAPSFSASSSSVMYTVSDSWVALSECFPALFSHCIVHCMMFLREFCCYGVVFASLLATKIMWVGSLCMSLYIYTLTNVYVCVYICIYTHKAYLRSAGLGFKTTKRVTLQSPSVIFLLMIVHSWMLFVEDNVSL